MRNGAVAIALWFALLLFPLFPYGAAANDTAITGGATETNYTEWRGVVGLILEGRYVCTATLIAPDILVTAAHCIYSTKKGYDYSCADIAVTGGSHLVNAPVTVGDCADIRLHEAWTGSFQDGVVDLALIRLTSPAAQEYYPLRTDDTALEEQGIVVGYGFLDPDDSATLAYHRKGNTRIIGKELVYGMHLIELGGESGTCSGDSGGPLFTMNGDRYEMTGVTTAGKGSDCLPGSGNMDIDLPRYAEWIVENAFAMNGNCLDDLCSANCGCPDGMTCWKNRCVGDAIPDEDSTVTDDAVSDQTVAPDEDTVPGGDVPGTTDDQEQTTDGSSGGCSLLLVSDRW